MTLSALGKSFVAIVAVGACFAFATRTGGSAAVAASGPKPNPVFSALLPTLKKTTSVPIRLPSVIAWSSRVLATTNTATSTEYWVELASVKNCALVHGCHDGFVAGWVIDSNAPQLTGAPLKLQNGTAAYYSPATCGASCDDSELYFDVSGYRYAVGLKGNAMQRLLQMANSFSAY
jgi:hypothetical protein